MLRGTDWVYLSAYGCQTVQHRWFESLSFLIELPSTHLCTEAPGPRSGPCLNSWIMKSGHAGPPTLLYESRFGYLQSFAFSYEFKYRLVNSYQKTCYDFVWDRSESRPMWGELASWQILSLPIHKHLSSLGFTQLFCNFQCTGLAHPLSDLSYACNILILLWIVLLSNFNSNYLLQYTETILFILCNLCNLSQPT